MTKTSPTTSPSLRTPPWLIPSKFLQKTHVTSIFKDSRWCYPWHRWREDSQIAFCSPQSSIWQHVCSSVYNEDMKAGSRLSSWIFSQPSFPRRFLIAEGINLNADGAIILSLLRCTINILPHVVMKNNWKLKFFFFCFFVCVWWFSWETPSLNWLRTFIWMKP